MQQTTRIGDILRRQPVGEIIEVNGWVRTRRDSGSFSFVEINDGSCLASLQVVADDRLANYETEVKRLATGCSVRLRGLLVASPAKGQAVELQA